MKFPWKTALFLCLVAVSSAVAYQPALKYWQKRNLPTFRTMQTESGEITSVVNSTGRIEPVLSVHVGSFVSGPVIKLYVDHNDEVKKDDMLAEIDPRIYKANVDRDTAVLASRRADIIRVKARLQNAVNDEKRANGLFNDNPDFISATEIDKYKFARLALDAEIEVAEASIKQAQASLSNSEANLGYTKIKSPVDGIVIDRKINPGQTLAAQFQAPELFIIAPDMRKEMHIFASVDEADIGLIRIAKEAGEKVGFTVDAYPGELFDGVIWQIRLSPTITQNVVTYTVVVSTTNESFKLLPGMTADISFRIEQLKEVTKIPNAALRYYPKREHVRKEDRKILDGTETTEDDRQNAESQPADAKAKAGKKRRSRHVWIKEGDLLKAIKIETGISDYQFTELISGDIKADQELVIGLK
ncbi:MAG: efflux RND transporter periplasmic adaptor subunit [Planctomycetaceae bacterium]|nr:efflux RND transporter periplasmic adaptor subunit [Planctomycetaceae bacterium]